MQNLQLTFVLCSASQKKGEDFAKKFLLLRIYELYDQGTFLHFCCWHVTCHKKCCLICCRIFEIRVHTPPYAARVPAYGVAVYHGVLSQSTQASLGECWISVIV